MPNEGGNRFSGSGSAAYRPGELQGDNYFVRFSSSGNVPEEQSGSPSDDRIKKLRERQPREKLLSNHVLLIPKSKLEDTLKARADLLEKKPNEKK